MVENFDGKKDDLFFAKDLKEFVEAAKEGSDEETLTNCMMVPV